MTIIPKLKEHFYKRKYQEILTLISQSEKQEVVQNLSIIDRAKIIYYKCRALERTGQLEEALEVVTRASEEMILPEEKLPTIILHVAQLSALWGLNQLEKALMVGTDGDRIIERLTPEERENGVEWIGLYYYMKGNIYHAKGEIEAELLCLHLGLPLFEKIGDSVLIATTLSIIGSIYFGKGELDTALEYFQRLSKLAKVADKQLGHVGHFEGMALGLLGEVYRAKGEIPSALDYFQQGLSLTEKKGESDSALLSSIGTLYHAKGDLDKAKKHFQHALTLQKNEGYGASIAASMFQLILISLDQQEKAQAQYYLTQLRNLQESPPTILIKLYQRVAEALLLKQSKRMKDKVQAQLLLSEITREKVVDSELTSLAMVHLCELLLEELKLYGEPEVLTEIHEIIRQLHTLAQNQESHYLVIRSFILQAKLAIIDGDLQVALKTLRNAKKTADEKNLGLLREQLSEEEELLESEHDKWQQLIQRNAPIQERLEQVKFEKYIRDAKQMVMAQKLDKSVDTSS